MLLRQLNSMKKYLHENQIYAKIESGETTLAFANDEMLKKN